MTDMWLPGVERVTGNTGGSMTGDKSRKILLHSTEGGSIEGAIAAYRANNSWPTLTVDCPERRIVQHLPFDAAARALRNEAGGVQTNREGTILVQIEMVGTATNPASIGSVDDLAWFGREVVRPIVEATKVPLVSTVRWVAYPASYGKQAAQRLSPAAWDAYSGILGHQHAPENSHGDPGALNVAAIITAAKPPPPVPEEDDMASAIQIKTTGRSARMWFDGAIIGFKTDSDRANLLKAFKDADVKVGTWHCTSGQFDAVARAVNDTAQLEALEAIEANTGTA